MTHCNAHAEYNKGEIFDCKVFDDDVDIKGGRHLLYVINYPHKRGCLKSQLNTGVMLNSFQHLTNRQ